MTHTIEVGWPNIEPNKNEPKWPNTYWLMARSDRANMGWNSPFPTSNKNNLNTMNLLEAHFCLLNLDKTHEQ